MSISLKEKIKFSLDTKFWSLSNIDLLTKNLKDEKKLKYHEDNIHLKAGAGWLKEAQDTQSDGGFSGRFNIKTGWSSSYPETTGYIIPTLIALSKELNDLNYINRAARAVEFLLSLQTNEGGFPGREVNDNLALASIFNTGQIINGLLEWYKYSKDEKALDAAIKAGKWMASVQEGDGSWKKFTYLNNVYSYSSHASCWLADLGNYINDGIILDSALKHYEWVLKNQDPETGWFYLSGFSNEDHTEKKSVTHTIAYTLWGIQYMAEIFNRTDGLEAVEKAARKIADLQLKYDFLPGILNSKWESKSSYSCMTGNAQMALIWLRLYQLKNNNKYLDAAIKSIDSIKSTQNLSSSNKGIKGGIQGSFPIWGDYIFMAFPNWAAKFFIDAILMKKRIFTNNK